MPDTALGFLGLGVMGGPMARNLVKAGYPVVGFDTDAGRLKAFTAAGGNAATSAAATPGRERSFSCRFRPGTSSARSWWGPTAS